MPVMEVASAVLQSKEEVVEEEGTEARAEVDVIERTVSMPWGTLKGFRPILSRWATMYWKNACENEYRGISIHLCWFVQTPFCHLVDKEYRHRQGTGKIHRVTEKELASFRTQPE